MGDRVIQHETIKDNRLIRPRFRKDGVRLINGRQVNLIVALGIAANKRGIELLEFIEFECGVKIDKLEDIRDDQMRLIVSKLNGEK